MTIVSADVVEEAGECGRESTDPSMLGRSLEVEFDSRTGDCVVESYDAPALSDLGGNAPGAAGSSGK